MPGTAFYDSKAKKPKPWVIGFFIILPVIILIVGWQLGLKKVKDFKLQQQIMQEKDVLEEFKPGEVR